MLHILIVRVLLSYYYNNYVHVMQGKNNRVQNYHVHYYIIMCMCAPGGDRLCIVD